MEWHVKQAVIKLVFAARCKRGLSRHAVSVRLSVMFVHSVETNKHIFKISSPAGNHTISVFPYIRNGMAIFRRGRRMQVECRWGRQKSLFWAYFWLHCVLSTLRPATCYQHDAAEPPYARKLFIIAGSKRRSLLMAGDYDQMFLTRSLNVTPKTTEQHLTAR